MMRSSLLACVVALAACGSSERSRITVHVSGCTEPMARVLVFRGTEACASENPRDHGGGTETPLAVSPWIDPDLASPVTIDVSGSGSASVIVECGDGNGLVREWGCGTLEQGTDVSVSVAPVCSGRCESSDSCDPSTDEFVGPGRTTICVPRCDVCAPDLDAGERDSGGDDSGLDAGTDASVPPACVPPPEGTLFALEGISVDLARANPDTIVVASSGAGINVVRGTLPAIQTPFGRHNLQEGYGIAASAQYAYVASGNSVEADENNLRTLGIAGDGSLSDVGGLLDPDAELKDVELLSDAVLLAAAGDGGLRIYDVNNRVSPTPLGYVGVGGYAWDLALLADSHVVVAADAAGAVVVDVANHDAPALVQLPATSIGASAIAADPASGVILVSRGGAGVDVLAWDGNALALRGTYATDGNQSGVAIGRDRGWIADGTNGLIAIDLGDAHFKASIPPPLNEDGLPVFAHAVMIEGNYALVAAETAGVYVIDISCVP